MDVGDLIAPRLGPEWPKPDCDEACAEVIGVIAPKYPGQSVCYWAWYRARNYAGTTFGVNEQTHYVWKTAAQRFADRVRAAIGRETA